MKAEEVRSEQLAAIEDVVKAEQNCTVDKPVTTFTEEDVSVGSLGGTPVQSYSFVVVFFPR